MFQATAAGLTGQRTLIGGLFRVAESIDIMGLM